MVLVNERTRKVLASRVEMAETRAERRRGLLGRTSLPEGGALMLIPCFSVHTAFMRFRIDVVFLNRQRKILKIRPNMGKARMSLSLRAHSVLELPAGTLEATGTQAGDQLEFEKYDA